MRSGRVSVEVVGQDELAQAGAPGVALRGDVHVGGVGAQQPRRQQREGDAAPAAVHLQHNKTARWRGPRGSRASRTPG